jgi:hypothetical protein
VSTTQSDKSGKYSITLDNYAPITIDAFTPLQQPTCGIGWSAAGLQDALHTLVITTEGQSALTSTDKASNFELDGVT